jgi:amidophosphoribosyltransferase
VSILQEKCAVTAVVGEGEENLPAAALAREALFAMQHRGPEATGIASMDSDGQVIAHRGEGLVRDVYTEADIRRLTGSMAIGHDRYSTAGSKKGHAQPVLDEGIGFALGHNGNLTVTQYLQTFLDRHNVRTKQLNDSEMMGLAVAVHIRAGQDLPNAVELTYPLLRGAFSSVAMHDGVITAFRDTKGIRPLALGTIDGGQVVASETCGLDIMGATYVREVNPGEMVIITPDGVESRQIAEGESKLDIFEMIYFARPDSMLYGMPVNTFRRRCGSQGLAEQHPPVIDDTSNILVVPVPDTSIPAAAGYAKQHGLELEQAIIKNRYSGRMFMDPTEMGRRRGLRRKHNFVPGSVEGRDLILIDDSIVRLNTIPRIVELAKNEGARTVTVLIASPPIRFPDYYGIDTPEQSELVAAHLTIEEIRQKIGCEYLGYLSLDRLVAATGLPAEKFNLSPFNGEYPIGIGHYNRQKIQTPVSMECAA